MCYAKCRHLAVGELGVVTNLCSIGVVGISLSHALMQSFILLMGAVEHVSREEIYKILILLVT